MRVKDWKFERLDSGHWIASLGDKESPIFCLKKMCRWWVSNVCKESK
jgi:hypothetical protein